MFKVINVKKDYGKKENKVKVLENINLSFPKVGLVSIVGKSGCGKSTLLNLLIGLDSPTSGEIYYQNKNIKKFSSRQRKSFQNNEIGILFQHFNLFDELTSLENVILPALIKGESRKSAIKLAEELFNQYQLSSLIHQKFKTLSGGEKQRVALLRALINKPKVIIADEPTGALDSKNSELIMSELKKLSVNHLIIVVSHNDELMHQYEDYRIEIKDGNASELKICNEEKAIRLSGNKMNFNNVTTFLKLHLNRHKTRNIITSMSIVFSSLCLLLCLGYMQGSNASIDNYKSKSLLYTSATIAKKSLIEIPGSPILISKLTRPNEEEIDFVYENIPSVIVANNYQNVISSMPNFLFDNVLVEDIEFAPVYEFNNFSSLLVSGDFPDYDFTKVVVNQEFVNHYGYTNKEIIGHNLKLSFSSVITNQIDGGKPIKDEIEFNNNLIISGVVSEFSYLNQPRVYYSYIGLENLLANTILKNYSSELGREVSVFDVVTYAENDDVNSGYSYSLFINELEDVTKLFNLKETYDELNTFDITSNCYTIINSYSSMIDIISTSLIVFIIIAFLGAICILIITAYSNFTSNKKESAILSIIGMDKLSIFNIYNLENLLVTGIGLAAALILSKPIELLANHIIYNAFKLESLITIPLLTYLPLFILLIMFIVTSLSTAVPFLFYESGFILSELRDE